MSIKLTIGTAIYKIEESFLRANIEGIMKQLTDETELLLIDDCSPDNSGEICKEYAASDSRVRYVKMEKNGGLSRVRNRTIDEAAGKWIFFADGDDLFSDHFIETALRFCGTDHDIIIHERLKFTEEKGEEKPCDVKELIKLPANAGRELSISCMCLDPTVGAKFDLPSRAFYHAAWGALYRKDFLLKNSLRFPDGQKKAQDSVFNTEAYFCAGNIAYLPYIMYYYRSNLQGITRRYSKDLPEVSRSLIKLLDGCMQKYFPGDEEVKGKFYNHRIIAVLIDNMRLHVFHKDNKNSKEERKKVFLEFIDSEPFKTAINGFDAKKYNRPEWRLIVSLIRKKKFTKLDMFLRSDKKTSIVCGIDKRLTKIFR